jgi:hypothetical protein
VVVSNLLDGFDSYDISDGRHLANLPTPIIHNVPLPSLFIEDDPSILCGSSCGYVLLYSGDMKNIRQVLRHGGMNQIPASSGLILMSSLEQDIIQALVCFSCCISVWTSADPSEKAFCKCEARFIATASSEASSDNYVRIWRASSTSERFFFLVCINIHSSCRHSSKTESSK